MTAPKNGFWQLIATGLCIVLMAIVSAWVGAIAGDVSDNSKHVQRQEGAKLDVRLEKVEKAVAANHYELGINRVVLNSIASAIDGATPAGPVRSLPEESE